jgi:Multicopper oxidase
MRKLVIVLMVGLFATASAGAAEGPVPKGIPRLQHVFVIMMENHAFGQIQNNPQAPFTNGLMSSANLATNYFAVAHPSLTYSKHQVQSSTFYDHYSLTKTLDAAFGLPCLNHACDQEITDPSAIDAVTAPKPLETTNDSVPHQAGFYDVVPGTRHRATDATNLHVHGFAVPPVVPQDEVLMTCVDPAVGPARCGHRNFTYRYQVPADMPEGLYWYHPHVHGEVQAQMLISLSGAIVVEGPEDDARRAAGIAERILIVRQTQDVDAGKIQAAAMTAAAPSGMKSRGKATPTAIDTAHELLCAANSGIDEISLNGTPVPVGDGPESALARFDIAAGSKQLWRILNAATDAFLDLAIVDQRGVPLPLEVVARDGAPLTDDAGQRFDQCPLPSRKWSRLRAGSKSWSRLPPLG